MASLSKRWAQPFELPLFLYITHLIVVPELLRFLHFAKFNAKTFMASGFNKKNLMRHFMHVLLISHQCASLDTVLHSLSLQDKYNSDKVITG